MTAILFNGSWGLPAPTPPGMGSFAPGASDFFDTEKVTKKAPGTPRPPIFCPIGFFKFEIALPLNQVFVI